MLTYAFLRIQNDEYIYAYYPEGDQDFPGLVGIKESGEKRVLEESAKDFGQRYAYHALGGIDITKKTGTIAWY